MSLVVMVLTKVQNENYQHFLEHLGDWCEDPAYGNKYVVIHDKEIKWVQDEFSPAFEYTAANFPRDEFVIQRVIEENKINNFLSPAV